MKQYKTFRNGPFRLWKNRATALLAALTVVLTATAATGHAAAAEHATALMLLTGAKRTAIVLDGSTKIPEVTSPMLNLSTGSRATDVTLAKGQQVIIHRGDEIISATSKKETVFRLLSRLKLDLSPMEMVAVDVSGQQVELTVDEEIVYFDYEDEPAAYGTVRIPNPKMTIGTEQVVRPGEAGVRTSIYEVVWSGGKQVSRQLVEQLDSTAVDEIVEYGTAPAGQEPVSRVETREDGSGTLYFPSGATLEFSATKSMTATAYTAGHGGADYTTATGTFVRVGVVAVDKRVIPLGTRMYIVTDSGIVYGLATAEDTGVRGNKVDLYMPSYEDCINFGRRSCTVYILE